MSHPTTREELVVVQLAVSEIKELHETQKSVIVDFEHDVGEAEGSWEGSGSSLGGPLGSGSLGSSNPGGLGLQSSRHGM